jgi:hypothetical protein
MEHHISADIAYAVWQYWHATGDDEFFLCAGAEIPLETARFWASRAVAEVDGRRHIRHVIGPDEYHEDVDDKCGHRLASARIAVGQSLHAALPRPLLWLMGRRQRSSRQSCGARCPLRVIGREAKKLVNHRD